MLHRVGEFEKVSFEQFYNAMKDEFYEKLAESLGNSDEDGFEEFIKDMYDTIKLPVRSTSGSAGNDFKAPFTFFLDPGMTIKIPTGIRVKIDEGWWLACLPRSGHGFKYRIQLDNTMGVIDSDYYNKDETEQARNELRRPELLPHFSVHNLRHTFCTRFCENETNLKVIQEIMGHADISTTMDIYNEATKEKKVESFANLEGKVKIS